MNGIRWALVSVVSAIFTAGFGKLLDLILFPINYQIIFFASFVYGTGFIIAGLAQHWRSWYLGLIAMVSIAGGTVMTLAWGLLYKIVPVQHRGAVSGLATTTKGIGLLIGAPLAGLAIDLSRPYLDATDGYQILWPFCGLLILAAIPLLVRLMKVEDERSGVGAAAVPSPLP